MNDEQNPFSTGPLGNVAASMREAMSHVVDGKPGYIRLVRSAKGIVVDCLDPDTVTVTPKPEAPAEEPSA